jgi:hypothetical protein
MKFIRFNICCATAMAALALSEPSQAAFIPILFDASTTISSYLEVINSNGSATLSPIEMHYDIVSHRYDAGESAFYFVTSDINSGIEMKWLSGELKDPISGAIIPLKLKLRSQTKDYGWIPVSGRSNAGANEMHWDASEHSSQEFKVVVTADDETIQPNRANYTGSIGLEFSQHP